MRKLMLITVLMLASASAFAGQTRSLTLASSEPLVTSVSQPIVDRAAVAKVSVKLAQAAAPIQSDAAPLQTTTTRTQPAVQTAALATTTQPTTTQPTTTQSPTATKPAIKPIRKESYAHKARRIAARYGVYW